MNQFRFKLFLFIVYNSVFFLFFCQQVQTNIWSKFYKNQTCQIYFSQNVGHCVLKLKPTGLIKHSKNSKNS